MPNEFESLYVGCGLTQAPVEFRGQVASLKETLAENFSVLEFIGLENGTSSDVYRHDTGCVDKCTFFLGIVDFPSLGLGVEIERARALQKPVLLVVQRDVSPTRLIQGMAHQEANVTLEQYVDMKLDVPRLAIAHFLR